VLQVDVAGGDEGVDARARGALDGLGGALDVRATGARQPAHRRPAHRLGHRAHGLEIPLAGDGESGLDHVHAEALELAAERELLGQVHAAAR
jgi:hypothetical protein